MKWGEEEVAKIKKKCEENNCKQVNISDTKWNVGGALLDKSCMAISIERSYWNHIQFSPYQQDFVLLLDKKTKSASVIPDCKPNAGKKTKSKH